MADEYTPVFDEKMARDLVVAVNEGNELADTEFAQDIRLAPYDVLVEKYGPEVASNRRLYTQQRTAVAQIENADRNIAQTAEDTGLAVASGFVNTVGSLGSLTLGAAGAVDQYFDEENDGFSRAGVWTAEQTQQASEWIKSFQSQELADRRGLSGVEAQLDAEDNLAQYERDTADRDANFIDDLAWVGRGTLNNLGRIADDGALAGDLIAEGIGSMGPSVKLASVASKAITSTRTFQAAQIANAIAPTQGTRFLAMGADAVNRGAIAASVGVSEAAGVYSQTVNEVLGMTHGELIDASPEYQRMIDQGVDPDDAKTTLAANAGMDAFQTSFPMATALGVIGGKFEAMPMSTFRGSGFIGGLRQVGAQALEEGGQGLTGQLATNVGIRDNVDPSREALEGVPQALAEGIVAGAGMAGVLATPSAVGNAPRQIVEGTKAVVNSPAAQALASAAGDVVSAGGSALDAAAKNLENNPQAQAALRGVRAAGTKIADTAAPVVDAATEQVKDFNNRPDRAAQSENLGTLSQVAQLAETELTSPINPDQSDTDLNAELGRKAAVQEIFRTPAAGPVPQTFASTTPQGSSTLSRVGGILTKLTEKGVRVSKMSDSDVLYASQEMQNLRNSIPNLPAAIQEQVKKVIASEDFKNIQKRAASVDLVKTQTDSTAITPEVVQETKAVASTNPTNVNPVVVGKILEQDDRTDVTAKDIKVMKTAKRIGDAIRSRSEAYVEVQKKENVELSVKPEYRDGKKKLKPVDLVEAISRNIVLGSGDTRAPSVSEFASNIMQGAQSPEGTVEIDGIKTPVASVAGHFQNFAQHMINKVEAMNTSYLNRDANGNGTTEGFEHLGPNRKMMAARTENGAFNGKPVTYQGAKPGGVRFAGELYADAVATVEVYNALAEAFPEQFPAGPLSVPEFAPNVTQQDLSPTDVTQDEVDAVETEAAPTAVEEEVSPRETSDEQAETELTPETLREPDPKSKSYYKTEDEFITGERDQLVPLNTDARMKPINDALEFVRMIFDGNVFKNTPKIEVRKFLGKGLSAGDMLRFNDSVNEDSMMLSREVYETLKDRENKNYIGAVGVLVHELVHNIDQDTMPQSFYSVLMSEYDTANKAMKAQWDKYALTFDESGRLKAELLAEAGRIYITNNPLFVDQMPLTAKAIEDFILSDGVVEVEIVSEATPLTLAEMMAAETRTKDDFSAMSYEDLIESANRWFVEEEGMELEAMPESRQKVIKDITDQIIAHFNLPQNIVTGITWLRTPDKGHLGQTMWGERLIGMRAGAVKTLLNGDNTSRDFYTAEHTVFHELMHIIDAYASNNVTRPTSHSSNLFDTITGEEGAIYKEVMAAVEADPEMKTYFDYALSYNNIDTLDTLASELFAEIGALYLEDTEKARQLFPEGVKYVESIIKKAGGTIVGEATDRSATQESSGEEAVLGQTTSVADKTFDNLNPKFNEGFQKRQSEISYADGEGILSMVQEQPETEGYLEFVRLYKDELMAKANERLGKIKTNKSDKMSVKERILDGQDTTEYRRNKNTMMVDQTTGEYDPDLLSIAAVAVLDWLSGVRSANPQSLSDTMEDMGLTFDMVTEENIKDISFGVPPRDVAETLSKDIVRMWGLSLNRDTPMKDARGAIEGMVKELLESLLEMETGLIEEKKVPYFNREFQKVVQQSVFNVFPMMETQKAIGLSGQNAIKKMLAPELDTMPSIGAPSPFVDNTQSRGDVRLSKREKTTLKRMQNQGHTLVEGLTGMVEAVGFDNLSALLGKRDFSLLAERHPLRASIAGKNLSIERDYQEALSVVNAIRNSGFTLNGELPKVFYRVGISRVGRHQFKGINPQNNKILRALVTPTFSTLDMTTKKHNDAFWLTVAQAADISGFNKVENQKHSYLLENIQRIFNDKFGDAVEIVQDYLNGGEMDGAALVEAMGGEAEMQQLSAVFAVASLNNAVAAGTQNAFETSLSFELDGKTDGPGNMMANFGQGVLTAMDYMNFKRVGFFLGTKAMTLNEFYGEGKEHDLYEVTSLQGQYALYQEIANGSAVDKERFHAVSRFASAFGDLKYENGQYVMTRNTSKNPMTKTVYGSSERGIGSGLAQDMTMEMYKQLIANPDGITEYPGGMEAFKKDFELVFQTKFPPNVDWNKSFLDTKSMNAMKDVVTQTLGKVLSNTAKSVIGDEITKVNDTLVLMTAFQTEFLTAKFQELLDAKVKERAAKNEDKEDRTALTQRDYDEVIAQIRDYSPTYANGMQTLDIGSFTATDNGIKLSESMTGGFQMAAAMPSPELAGVKVIPYITQGRGDAMMMNWIYGGETFPENTLQVFDGIDMPIDKVTEYAQQINAAVLQNWESDVIGDIVNDVTGFLEKTASDGELLNQAWTRAFENAKKKKTKALATSPEQLIAAVIEMQRMNQARKTVFKKIGVSIDHMGGSATAFTSGPDGREWTLGQINDMIRQELGQAPVSEGVQENADGSIDGEFSEIETNALQIEDQTEREPVEGEFSKLVVTDAATVLDGLLRETRNKPVAAAVRILQKAGLSTRVVIGSPQEVSDWYAENVGTGETVLRQDKKGVYDPVNDVMLITDNNHETLVHELIHAATFQKVEDFYNGDTTNNAIIGRLETLKQEFMDMEIDTPAANSAKAQIIALEARGDAFGYAAALNEMMAWTLSNESLRSELSQKQTSLIKRMAASLKALMQRLLGGVKSDILSNIEFNTELLVTGEREVESTPPPVDTDGETGELTPNAQKFTNFWIDLAKQRLAEANAAEGRRSEKLKQISDYRKNAQAALDELDLGGFAFSAYQKETFKAIHMVLAMEMRLDDQSALALNDMFKHVTDNLTPEMFGLNNTQDRYSAVMEIFGASKNEEGVSDAIAVLLALSQTSNGFRNALDQLPVPESVENVSGASLNEFLSSLTGMLMNKAVGSIDLAGKSVTETLDDLSNSILIEESEKEFRLLSGLMKNISKADAHVSGVFKKLAGYTEQVNEEMRASTRSNLTKVTVGAIASATAFLDQDRAEIQAEGLKRVTHMGTNLDWAVPVREFVNEMIGTDDTNRNVVALQGEANYGASAVRQNYREDLPVLLQDEFENRPDANQWKATHKVLGRTDFSAVYDENRPNQSFEMFKDENIIDTRIAQAEGALRSNYSVGTYNVIQEKAQQLADFMNGKGPGHQLWRNAFAINMMAGDYQPGMTEEIDQLISLYAMKGSDPQMRQEITRMYEKDPEAMQNLAVYMKGLNKEEDLKVVTDVARMNGYKGYIPDLAQAGKKVIIAKDEDRRELEKKGYKRVADATADRDFSTVNRGYYVTSTKQTGTYSQGVMQLIQDTYRGVDATTGLSVNGQTAGIISGSSVEVVTDHMNTLSNGLPDNKEALLPVYDMDGVLHYERYMNPDIVEKYTAPKSNLALMLGVWAGRQVEEKFAQKYNNLLIDELKRIYDTRGDNDDELFVNLPELAAQQKAWDRATVAERRRMKKPDRVFVESWNVISPQTKRHIEEVFGKDQFYVRKDQMNTALGYRDPSVVDLWTGNTRVPEALREGVQAITSTFMGKNAMKAMVATEGAVQGVVSNAKDLIVVRSLVVPYMNTQANVVQLSTRGVPLKTQIASYKAKLSEIEQFNKNRKELIRLDTRIQLAGTDMNKVRILQGQKQVILDQNKRFSVAPLIEAGLYSNISEGITEMDVDLVGGRVGDWIEKQIDSIPNQGVKTIAKYGILSRDTAIYKGANKAVQYGDFIAKGIYYDHLIDKGLSHEDALKVVNEEFVNFLNLPGRTRTYLEGIGATWFLTFKIRIMKIAMNQIRENPARSLLLAATVADFGSPQADNLASVIADDRIGYALGWDMLFGSASLNPWLNLYD